jgi:Mn2+/Fe2+ NRAMP family transporter
MQTPSATPHRSLLARLGPGLLVAATGVGAGDLLTAALGGSALGVSLLWAAAGGALIKWLLNEGIARWQLATGTTLLEGWTLRLGRWIRWLFLAYFLAWSFFTGGALINACGVAGTALLPLSANPDTSKLLWGLLHSLAGLALVRLGGFRLFERIMSACVGLMFVTVTATAVLSRPDWGAAARGLLVPSFPPGGASWVLGMLGGVGGTVTLLSYGYWIREEGREGPEGLRACRVDLGVAYTMTALFGLSMVLIGSTLRLEGSGVRLAPLLAGKLAETIGPAGRWIFLAGFWAAVFTSLLGVWQSAPYLFADFLSLQRRQAAPAGPGPRLETTAAYRLYLVAIALVPLPMLLVSVKRAQLAYATLGSLFMPLLALTLLLMNNRRDWVGDGLRNGRLTNAALALVLLLFLVVGYLEAADQLRELLGG